MSENMLSSDAAVTSEGAVSQTAAQATSQTAPATDPVAQAATQQQATEGQTSTEQGKPAVDGQVLGEKTEAPVGAPEKYEFVAPEGKSYDPTVIGQFSEVAKDLNLPQDAAQKLLDKMSPVIEAQQLEAVQNVQNQWTESAKADKEFGGEKLAENLSVAKKALDRFGSPELRTLLNESGLGNHPEMIRVLYRAGKAISEDTIVTGRTTPGSHRDAAKSLYPNQQK